MNFPEFQSWILSAAGWKDDIDQVTRLLALQEFPHLQQSLVSLSTYKPDWQKLLLIGSILAKSDDRDALESALAIAQAGFIISKQNAVADASLLILNQLSNQRTMQDALTKGFVEAGFEQRLGITARMTVFREAVDNKIFLCSGDPITGNKFQNDFWHSAETANWLYASAPTAAGKSYIVFKHILERIALRKAKLAIYVAPTRALVSEVEQKIRALAAEAGLEKLSVSSIPMKELYNQDSPTVLVFTQERLHIFLNSLDSLPKIDILVIDEVQKLNDGMRGVILQDAIERVLRTESNAQVIYLSPNTENPKDLFKDAPDRIRIDIIDRDQPMVSQNLIWASERGTGSQNWQLEIRNKSSALPLGEFDLKERPTTLAKKMALIAAELGGSGGGFLVYANEPKEAEDIAEFIAELVTPVPNENLKALSGLARDGVHRNFKLVRTVKSGVAFHYGNMPSLLREEIEEAFNKGDIRFLVCTSTLIEGVNLSCKTILVQGPRKGRSIQMEAHDFWNLAGRAGRWGKEFQGNIVCVEPNIWKQKPPERSKFKLKRQTEEVLNDKDAFLEYLSQRNFDAKTINSKNSFESVLAYLLTTFMREGSLKNAIWAKNYSASYLLALDNNLSLLSQKIDIPLSIIEKHSGISGVSMQSLLDYFRKDYGSGKKQIENLIPLTAESEESYKNMEDLLRRIHLKLQPAFGFGQQYRHYAVLILNWMRGHTLSRLIQGAIDEDKKQAIEKGRKLKNEATIIRDTMREVEEIARFKAPKYISCYTDVLKLFLKEQNKLDLYPSDYPFDLFLEFGVMSKTLLSLVGLGLSRMTATEIGKEILQSNYSKEESILWLTKNLETKEMPEFVKREVRMKIFSS